MGEYFGFAQELLEKGRASVADTYGTAELYDLVVQSQADQAFYVEIASRLGGRVLDLACGSGRLLPPLQEAGLEVVGLDLSSEMLEQARRKLGTESPNVELIQGDMRTFNFCIPFNTILIPYCSLMYMHSDQDRLAVFNRCYNHLNPGGYLAFDFLAGEVEVGEALPALALQGIHPFTEDVLISIVQVKGLAPDLRLLNQINYIFPQEAREAIITVQASKEAIVCPHHMVSLLEQSGFSVEGICSNCTLQAYDGGEECLIVAKKLGSMGAKEDECEN